MKYNPEELGNLNNLSINIIIADILGVQYTIEQEDKPSAYLWSEDSGIIDYCSDLRAICEAFLLMIQD